MSVPFERRPPTVVPQSSATRCWAAALESWMRAEGMSVVLPQEQLVDIFRAVPGALERDSERATTEVGASLMAHFTWMNAGLFSGAQMTADFWGERLETGYVFVWYAHRGVGHCGVIYGVTRSVVKIMDPWQGRGLIEKKVDFFHGCQNALVGVSMFSHHVRNPFEGIFAQDRPALGSRPSDTLPGGYNF